MKIYQGTRSADHAVTVTVDGKPLPPRQDLRNHSPSGFEWGFGGSGPAQLALALCADAVGDKRAVAVYQDFKWRCISPLRGETWRMTEAEITNTVELLEVERGIAANGGRVWVVTVKEPGGVTRCQFAAGAAHDFMAWISSKGRSANLRIMEDVPDRSPAEVERAVAYVADFSREWL